MTDTAKIFMTGRSQAVRLPARYRFEEREVFIRRDDETGDVILSPRPEGWASLFSALEGLTIPEDFPGNRQQPASGRDPLTGKGVK